MNKTIVSLIASATEIVFALKQDKNLVGRSHGCDYPSDVEHLPVLTQATFPITGSSIEIDSLVKGKLSEGLSVYEIDQDKLAKLSPDVILTQDQCEVCAASLSDVEAAVCEWTGKPAKIVSLKPECLDDVFKDIQTVADALGCSDAGADVVSEMRSSMEAISKTSARIEKKPRVVCIEWIDPLMAGGNWMPEIVRMAGGVNLFGEEGRHSDWVTWEEIRASDPDVIFITPCGYDIARSVGEMDTLVSKEGWADMKAVRNGEVYVIDGNHYFNRPGPRLKDSLEILSEILHPEVFSFGYEGERWIRHSK